MSAVSQELVRALSAVAPDVIGKKKWRRLLFAVHRELAGLDAENVAGPIAAERREALQVLESAMRRCLIAKARG